MLFGMLVRGMKIIDLPGNTCLDQPLTKE